jgi:diguanylate cyclase (GGDEF)-like protein
MSTKERSLFKQAKILVVDDQPDNVELLATILTIQGYEVQKSSCGIEAIELVKTNPPDMILLDISMPEVNGFEVCRTLKSDRYTQDIPIIFISALQEAQDKTQAFNFGGNDYIAKPFQIEEVIVRVKNQLKISRLQQALKAKNLQLEHQNRQLQAAEERLLLLNQKLNQLATLDGLTQIANRYRFDEFLNREWQRGKREQFPLSLILCDIDYFKLYNDRFGHQEGDICLTKVAQTISKTVQRPADLVARYGGEEFAIILPQTPAKSALQVAEKIRLQVKSLVISHPDSLVSDYVTLSLGVSCVIPNSQYQKQQLLLEADRALYQAKKTGRDRSMLKSLDLVNGFFSCKL